MGATCSREDPEQEHDHDDNGRRHTNQADGGGGAGAKGALNGGRNAVGNSSGNGGGGSAAKVVLPGSRSPDVRSEWQFDKVLGRGQFGVTRLVVHRVTGERAACKSISKRKLVNPEDVEDVRREIRVMHHLSGHPHVVGFKGAYEDATHVHIVMELCTGGELFEHIAARGHYRERDAAHLLRSLLMVVEHCHAMNVVHRDLKPENFLFREPGRRHIMAIDFGLSTFYQEGQVLRELVGSPFYMAPEVLRRSYGPAADIWSVGVIGYILLCGSPPFFGAGTQQIFRAVLHDTLDLASPPWDTVSAGAKDCIRRMLVRDPARRATASEVLAHDWMRGNGAAAGTDELQPEILARMRAFADFGRLKKEALRVIAGSLPPEQIEGVRRMFAEMDDDGSGTISFGELREGLRRKGAHIADGELQRLMEGLDLDGSATLDFDEFLAATVFLGKLERRELMLAAFQHFDADGSGFITEEELRAALKQQRVPEAQIAELLAGIDRDGDGKVDYEEFCRMLLPTDVPGSRSSARRTPRSARDGRRSGSGGAERSHAGSESRRHIVMAARSGAWAASGHVQRALRDE